MQLYDCNRTRWGIEELDTEICLSILETTQKVFQTS